MLSQHAQVAGDTHDHESRAVSFHAYQNINQLLNNKLQQYLAGSFGAQLFNTASNPKALVSCEFQSEIVTMYDTCHPAFYEMGKLGCTNVLKNTIAFQTYLELCEVKRLWDVQYKYNKTLDVIYLEARTSKSTQLQKYVPWPAMNSISLSQIEKMQKELETERLTLVFMEGDSTSVYYCVSSSLVKPSSPEQSKEFKHKEEKKVELENEIRRNTSNLYELATSVKNKQDSINLQSSEN